MWAREGFVEAMRHLPSDDLTFAVCWERFLEEMQKGETQAAIRQLQEKFGGRKMLLGIDRLDPIKGIPHKLLAFEKSARLPLAISL